MKLRNVHIMEVLSKAMSGATDSPYYEAIASNITIIFNGESCSQHTIAIYTDIAWERFRIVTHLGMRPDYVLMETVLRLKGIKIISTDDDLYHFVIDISTGSKSFDEIVKWLKKNTKASG